MIFTCRKLVEKVTDAREGKLSLAERVSYSVHLAWCRHCRLYTRQMEATVQALRSARQTGPAPAAVREAVLKRFQS